MTTSIDLIVLRSGPSCGDFVRNRRPAITTTAIIEEQPFSVEKITQPAKKSAQK
jgi:hypothetical protein